MDSLMAEADIPPLRTISVMVNAVCNLRCPHCDLPRRYSRYRHALPADRWEALISEIATDISPGIVAVSAMEPLLPKIGQPKTAAILRAGKGRGARVGLVTNGTYAQQFLEGCGKDLEIDFFDVSVDGVPHIDEYIRGRHHFTQVDHFLREYAANSPNIRQFFISFTLTHLMARGDLLEEFLDWVCKTMPVPRLVVLPIYINENVVSDLRLRDGDLRRSIEIIAARSHSFETIFLDFLMPESHDLMSLISSGTLPSSAVLSRDSNGMAWGHVGENLYVRYQDRTDLLRYTLRLSPEGHVLSPEDVEKADYLSSSLGCIPESGWTKVKHDVLAAM